MLKKIKCIILVCLLVAGINELSAQFAVFGLYSGMGHTLYDFKGYNQDRYTPIGLRASIGVNTFQFGGECNFNMNAPSHISNDVVTGLANYNEEFKDNYLGAMLRIHMADYVGHFAVILRGGVGMHYGKQVITFSDSYKIINNVQDRTVSMKSSLGLNAGFGFSIPLLSSEKFSVASSYPGALHLTIEGQYNYNKRDIYNPCISGNEKHDLSGWDLQIGLSYVFAYSK